MYTIDIETNFVVNYLPEYNRLPKFTQMLRSYLSQINLINNSFELLKKGSDSIQFKDETYVYSFQEKVRDNFSLYYSLINENESSTYEKDKWKLILPSNISSYERAKISCRKMRLEYHINHFFSQQLYESGLVGFKNPEYIDGDHYMPKSDIFIETIPITSGSFISGANEISSSSSFENRSSGFSFDEEVFIYFSSHKFSINVPDPVRVLLGDNSDIIIENEVKKYVPTGVSFIINYY